MHNRITVIALALLAVSARANAQGYMGDIVPVHSFADIPVLPRSVAELTSRKGEDGKDKAAEALRQRIDGWTKSMAASIQAANPADYMSMGASARGGAMSPAAGNAIGQLMQTNGAMTSGYTQTMQQFHLQTMASLAQDYEKKLDAANKTYEKCLQRTSTKACHGEYVTYRAAFLAAGDEFLHNIDGPFAQFAARMQQFAAQGETAIGQATKAFGANPPALVRTQVTGIRQNELNTLLAVLTAEQDIFDKVQTKAPVELASPDRD